mmetsp:Transcript_21457/g.64049  ORF Transcript_21457/g.64049 Transcript_21457/m.64049 type:complete len:270 (+) Transcript_21457:161-970(+)
MTRRASHAMRDHDARRLRSAGTAPFSLDPADIASERFRRGPAREAVPRGPRSVVQPRAASHPGATAAAARHLLHLGVQLVGLSLLNPALLLQAQPHTADKASVEVMRVDLPVTIRVEGGQHVLDILGALFGTDDPGDVLEVVEGDGAGAVVIEELEDVQDVIGRVLGTELCSHALEELLEIHLVCAEEYGDVLLHGDAEGHGGSLQLLRIDETAPVLIDHVEGPLHVHNLVHSDLTWNAIGVRIERRRRSHGYGSAEGTGRPTTLSQSA